MNCAGAVCLAAVGRCAPLIHHLLFTIHNCLEVSRLGLEPRTPALKGQCSTIELPAHVCCAQGAWFSLPPSAAWTLPFPRHSEQEDSKMRGLALRIFRAYTGLTAPVNTNRSGRNLSPLTRYGTNCTLLNVSRTLERSLWRQFASTSKR